MNLQEKIEKLRNEELEKIKHKLKPHFEKYGTIEINHHFDESEIFIQYHNWDNRDVIVRLSFDNNTYDNEFELVYERSELNIGDIFKEVGENLAEIKVKQIKEFDAEEWKREFAKRHNLSTSENDNEVIMNSGIVINRNLDVNHNWWHRELFAGKHKLFKFNCRSRVIIDSQELADEFERVFVIMRNHLENVPNLNKGADNDK